MENNIVSHFIHEPGHVHFTTFSCAGKRWLFNSPGLYQLFIDHLERARHQHRFLLYGYILMPNHIHLLWQPTDETVELSGILHSIKRPFAYQALKVLRVSHPELVQELTVQHGQRKITRFWQPGGGLDRNLTDPERVRSALEYMHGNPVRRGLVETPTEWTWSSARFWENGTVDPIRMDVPEWLGEDPSRLS